MSERRSARATKGQNKTLEQSGGPIDTPSKKGKNGKIKVAAKKQQQTEEAAEEEVIRCICGATEQDDDSDEAWISCERCNVWQHNVCMGITTDEKELESLLYYCEECNPEDHKETLAAIVRGEEPWRHRQQIEGHGTLEDNKKKKKGSKKNVNDTKASSRNTASQTSATPKPETPRSEVPKRSAKSSPAIQANVQVEEKDNETVDRTPSTKRKASEVQEDLNKIKMRRKSSQLVFPVASSMQDLDVDRQGPAGLISKNLTLAMETAKKNNVFEGSPSELKSKVTQLTLAIEKAVYESHPNKQAYREQCKRIGFNLKQNPELCERLLVETLTPVAFAVMSVEEMASKALQEEVARMKAMSDKNNILISEEGPRIRRTHKGEEIIEDQDTIAHTEEMPAQRRRSTMPDDEDMADQPRENSPGNAVELPEDVGYTDPEVLPTLNIVTTPPLPRKESTQNDSFDINKVFAKVQPPTSVHHGRTPSRQQLVKNDGPGEDADIDRMLEDGNESPPYSPVEYDADPSIVWRGHMQMTSIASYPAIGRYIGGCDLDHNSLKISELVPETLTVAGRIDVQRATEYLCSLRYSSPTDIVVIAITPTGESATDEANKLYDYFTQKKKYGVVGNKIYANVRDTYLIPVAAGDGPIPEFLTNIENHKLPTTRPENIILVTMVIRHPQLDSEGHNPLAPVSGQAPVSVPQRQMTASTGPTMSPVDRQNSFHLTPSETPVPQENNTQVPQSAVLYAAQVNNHLSEEEAYRRGVEVAQQILGDLINAPTVNFLLPSAGAMQASEWQVIKTILSSDELARRDLPHLSKLLQSDSKP